MQRGRRRQLIEAVWHFHGNAQQVFPSQRDNELTLHSSGSGNGRPSCSTCEQQSEKIRVLASVQQTQSTPRWAHHVVPTSTCRPRGNRGLRPGCFVLPCLALLCLAWAAFPGSDGSGSATQNVSTDTAGQVHLRTWHHLILGSLGDKHDKTLGVALAHHGRLPSPLPRCPDARSWPTQHAISPGRQIVEIHIVQRTVSSVSCRSVARPWRRYPCGRVEYAPLAGPGWSPLGPLRDVDVVDPVWRRVWSCGESEVETKAVYLLHDPSPKAAKAKTGKRALVAWSEGYRTRSPVMAEHSGSERQIFTLE